MVKKYRKKPVVIEALQFTDDNKSECMIFLDGNWDNTLSYPNVKTLNGVVRISPGEYIVKGVSGEFYPCAAEIFEQTYDVAPFAKYTTQEKNDE